VEQGGQIDHNNICSVQVWDAAGREHRKYMRWYGPIWKPCADTRRSLKSRSKA
jgi:hypothetical protein